MLAGVQIKLTDDNEKEMRRIVSESRGLFCVSGLVNLIIDHWRFIRENEQKLKASYSRPAIRFGPENPPTEEQTKIAFRETLSKLRRLEKETKTQLYAHPQKSVSSK